VVVFYVGLRIYVLFVLSLLKTIAVENNCILSLLLFMVYLKMLSSSSKSVASRLLKVRQHSE
jgi:hypothetical protein